MTAYGVPWMDSLPIHPSEVTVTTKNPKGFVSYTCGGLQKASSTYMGIITIWI